MSTIQVALEPVSCPRCSSQVAPSLLVCPGCGGLMHGLELKRLAGEAARAAELGELQTEIALWRRALELLPPGTQQHRVIVAKVDDLARRIDAGGQPLSPAAAREAAIGTTSHKSGSKAGWSAGLIGFGLLLFKFKALVLIVLTKGKLLLLGLTKMSTLGSMVLSLGVYWTLWGWKFALGLVVSIYIHEMGHVAQLRKYGFRASAPTFIPGLGALIRLKQHPVSGREDARVGLAGPLWGLGAALAAAAVYFATGSMFWGAIARVGAWINLFNLLPIASLDGGRGFRALNRTQRWIVTAAFTGSWLCAHDGLLLILAVISGGVTLTTKPSEEADTFTLVQFLGLIVALTALLLIPLNVQAGGFR